MSNNTANDTEEVAAQVYVTGVGWCWMRDGEIIEVIHQQGLDDPD